MFYEKNQSENVTIVKTVILLLVLLQQYSTWSLLNS